MTVKEHYDKHLGNYYSWMTGDFESGQNEFQKFLKVNAVLPTSTKSAIDLGAGHGLQSIPLALLGFNVTAVDFSIPLLEELKFKCLEYGGLEIEILNEDIKNVRQFADKRPELIICCGDTISHLENKDELAGFIKDISGSLITGGKVLLSFRDYTKELTGDQRFIHVKSDDNRILTCVLDYEKEHVRVTDLLYEKNETGWEQKISSYKKIRVIPSEISEMLAANNLKIQIKSEFRGMNTLLAVKI